MPFMHVERFNQLTDAQQALAGKMLEWTAAASSEGRPCRMALSGGNTPLGFFERWGSLGGATAPGADLLRLYWVDERCVPWDDPASNYGAFGRHWKGPSLSASVVHPMYHPGVDPETAAQSYEALLRRDVPPDAQGIPVFDVVVLGLGSDGHTASLFPGDPAVQERGRLIVPIATPRGRPAVPRLSMTLPLINAARRVVFLVSGADKKEVFQHVLKGGPGAEIYPAAHVRPRGELCAYVDASIL